MITTGNLGVQRTMQVCDGDALLPGGGEETMQIGDIKNLLMPMLDDAHWQSKH